MEISHRSATFEGIIQKAEADIRALAGVPASYTDPVSPGRREPAVLDGAAQPADRRPHGRLRDDGLLGRQGRKEARRSGRCTRPARRRRTITTVSRHPPSATFTPGAAYVHITSNNTIEGTQWNGAARRRRRAARQRCLVGHLQRPDRRVEVRADLRGRAEEPRPVGRDARHHPRGSAGALEQVAATMLNYAVHAENGSLYNTPPAFGVYVLGLVMEWLRAQGGLPAMATVNERKAGKLYAELDRTGFWRPTARAWQPEPDERHVPPRQRGSGEGVRQGGDDGRARRLARAPLGRRHARVDLQRVPRERRGRRSSTSCASSSGGTGNPRSSRPSCGSQGR